MLKRFLLVLMLPVILIAGCEPYQAGPSFEPTKEGMGWDYGSKVNMGARFTSSPVLVNDRIFLTSLDGSMYAFDALRGKKLEKDVFSYRIPQGIRSTPVVLDGILYFGAFDYKIHGIDSLTGEERFIFETDGYISASPIVKDNVLFIGSYDGFFRAIDLTSKQLKWSYDSKAKIEGVAAFSKNGVVFADENGKVTHLDVTDGSMIWQKEFGAGVFAGVVTTDSLVIFADSKGAIRVLNIADGSIAWEYKASDDSARSDEQFWTLPTVFIVPVKIDIPETETGTDAEPVAEIKNESDIPESDTDDIVADEVDPAPVMEFAKPEYEDAVFIGSSLGVFYAFRLYPESGTAEMLWESPFDINPIPVGDSIDSIIAAEKIFSSATVADGRIFFGSNDGKLYCLDQAEGYNLWSFHTYGEIRCTPLVASGFVVFMSNDHYLYGLSVEDGLPIRG